MRPGATFDEQSAEALEALARVVELPPRCKDCGGRFVSKHDVNDYCPPCEMKRWNAFMAQADEEFENQIWGHAE